MALHSGTLAGTAAWFVGPGARACNQTQQGRDTRAQGPARRCQLKDVAPELEPGQSPTWCFARWSSVSQPFCVARPSELWGREIHASASAGIARLVFLSGLLLSSSWLVLPSLRRVGSWVGSFFGSHLRHLVNS